MNKIYIGRNTLGDTRTATKVPTYDEFMGSNKAHRSDVRQMMDNLCDALSTQGSKHDYTKITDNDGSLFYRELCATIEGKMSFVEGEWYPMHCETERHHLKEHCPDDVNLLDVLEMICDCVCAGMARSGVVRPVELSDDILRKAFENTVKMCEDSVIINE